ncbi:MAG: hypothetical protein J4F28_08655, partial [Nitrosopumilaceae archaeon]|nr:hypothetical protein [Nitrosopumilaceae archaeon]
MCAHSERPSGLLLDVAPVWGRDVYDARVPRARLEHLNVPDWCLVGEAHGFSAGYADPQNQNYCETCSMYSLGIWGHYLDAARLRELAERFAEHFAASHRQTARLAPVRMGRRV